MKPSVLLLMLGLLACEAPFSFPAPVASVTIAPADADLAQGDSLQLTVAVRDSTGTPLTDRTVLWSSSDPTRILVSAAGLVTALTAGAATITATVEAASDTARIRVVARVAGLSIPQGDLTLVAGGTLPFTAVAYDPGGNPLAGRPTMWTSGDTVVLRVSGDGVATATTEGTTILTATVSGVSTHVTVRVARVRFTAVSASEFRHTCARATNGRFFCWGENGLGQLGIAAVPAASAPAAAALAPTVAEVSGGGTFTCARTGGGHADCWGSGARGRLGNGTPATSPTPTAVALAVPLETLSSGWNHTCGIGPDGGGVCWGEFPQVGNEPGPIAWTPVTVLGDLRYLQISAGEGFTCGLTTDSLAYCWGANYSNRLGVGDLPNSVEPVAVTGATRFAGVGAGGVHACGVTAAGTVWCWGDNTDGQLGTGAASPDSSPRPLAVAGGHVFTAIAVGSHSSCAIDTTGAAYCWGANDAGQLGAPSTESCGGVPCSRTPIAVAAGLAFSQLAVGDHHTCGLATTGILYCWGLNDRGQLGDGATINRTVPTPVLGQR
jgi:alpha-tubulin suppressor-like RCC1 family protein